MQEKSNAEIKKQFTDMKAFMTVNSSKFDAYIKANDTKIAEVDTRVNKLTSKITELQKQFKGLQDKLKTVENDLANTQERVDQAERDVGAAANELRNKNTLFRKVEAKINAEEEEIKRCSVLLEGVPEITS